MPKGFLIHRKLMAKLEPWRPDSPPLTPEQLTLCSANGLVHSTTTSLATSLQHFQQNQVGNRTGSVQSVISTPSPISSAASLSSLYGAVSHHLNQQQQLKQRQPQPADLRSLPIRRLSRSFQFGADRDDVDDQEDDIDQRLSHHLSSSNDDANENDSNGLKLTQAVATAKLNDEDDGGLYGHKTKRTIESLHHNQQKQKQQQQTSGLGLSIAADQPLNLCITTTTDNEPQVAGNLNTSKSSKLSRHQQQQFNINHHQQQQIHTNNNHDHNQQTIALSRLSPTSPIFGQSNNTAATITTNSNDIITHAIRQQPGNNAILTQEHLMQPLSLSTAPKSNHHQYVLGSSSCTQSPSSTTTPLSSFDGGNQIAPTSTTAGIIQNHILHDTTSCSSSTSNLTIHTINNTGNNNNPADQSGNDPLKCSVCGKKFNLQRLLNRHMKCHSDVKRYSCAFCGKGFNDTFDLKRHIRTHSGVRPYKCSECEKSFTQRCSLESHSLKVHSIAHRFAYKERRPKVYVCEECGNTTSSPEVHFNHLRDHHQYSISSQTLAKFYDKRRFKFPT